jgi:hypothetical protein
MNNCQLCHAQFTDDQLTEIGLGSNLYQCEKCWANFGEPISCAHDYAVEKGISFCLDCGQFEDYLEQTDTEGANA